jgi:hypothetical protein
MEDYDNIIPNEHFFFTNFSKIPLRNYSKLASLFMSPTGAKFT